MLLIFTSEAGVTGGGDGGKRSASLTEQAVGRLIVCTLVSSLICNELAGWTLLTLDTGSRAGCLDVPGRANVALGRFGVELPTGRAERAGG